MGCRLEASAAAPTKMGASEALAEKGARPGLRCRVVDGRLALAPRREACQATRPGQQRMAVDPVKKWVVGPGRLDSVARALRCRHSYHAGTPASDLVTGTAPQPEEKTLFATLTTTALPDA